MKFSTSFKSSKKPRKQRVYRKKAPLHIKQKFASCHLSKDLKKKHNLRSMILKKGDKIKVVRGQHKGKTGAVDKVFLRDEKAIIGGIEISKKDGSKTPYKITISNMIITELNLDDKKRQKVLDRKKENKNG